MRLAFSRRELRDLAVAWLALGVAFAILLNYGLVQSLLQGAGVDPLVIGRSLTISMLTVGVGFLLHELAHKVVAVRYGQVAEFRADYNMLLLAIFSAMVGFLFAAPGAVHHRGWITERQNGLIALAGPATNVVLVVLFLPLIFVPVTLIRDIGILGAFINAFLAGFNMIPFGPLDGKKVLEWSKPVFVLAFIPTAGLALMGLFFLSGAAF